MTLYYSDTWQTHPAHTRRWNSAGSMPDIKLKIRPTSRYYWWMSETLAQHFTNTGYVWLLGSRDGLVCLIYWSSDPLLVPADHKAKDSCRLHANWAVTAIWLSTTAMYPWLYPDVPLVWPRVMINNPSLARQYLQVSLTTNFLTDTRLWINVGVTS